MSTTGRAVSTACSSRIDSAKCAFLPSTSTSSLPSKIGWSAKSMAIPLSSLRPSVVSDCVSRLSFVGPALEVRTAPCTMASVSDARVVMTTSASASSDTLTTRRRKPSGFLAVAAPRQHHAIGSDLGGLRGARVGDERLRLTHRLAGGGAPTHLGQTVPRRSRVAQTQALFRISPTPPAPGTMY